MVCTFPLIVNRKVTVDQYLHLPKNLVCRQNIIFWEVSIELLQRTHCWFLTSQKPEEPTEKLIFQILTQVFLFLS